MTTHYTTLSLAEVREELAAIARDTECTFGGLGERQLNWRPDATRWSVAQCLDHLVTANAQMADMADAALDATRSRTLWQRLPGLPRRNITGSVGRGASMRNLSAAFRRLRYSRFTTIGTNLSASFSVRPVGPSGLPRAARIGNQAASTAVSASIGSTWVIVHASQHERRKREERDANDPV